tara:strand:- start:166 stop:447 length:282 start_codon:yes stop_codon:yes gene_type:complete
LVKPEIIKSLRKKFPQLKKSQINSILKIIFESMTQSLKSNKAIELRNFGRISTKTTRARHDARNPKTGEIIFVPEKKKIYFKMAKHLKEEINK